MDGLFLFPDAVRQNPAIDRWFEQQKPELAAVARTWFDCLRACSGEVRDVMHDGCPTACVGDAAFAYVGVYTGHVNIGFFRGADLDDPAGLLVGTGRRMRHVKLTPGVAIDASALRALIVAAHLDMHDRLAAAQR